MKDEIAQNVPENIAGETLAVPILNVFYIQLWNMKEIHIEAPNWHVIRFGTSHFE